MDRYYYEQDWKDDPPLRVIYRKFQLEPTGNMTTCLYDEFPGSYRIDVPETRRINVKRISKEEYENQGEE